MEATGQNSFRKVALGVGGAMVSAFVPSVIPDAYEPWAVALGGLMMLGAAIWYFIRQKMTVRLNNSDQSGWISLSRALWYLIDSSEWSRTVELSSRDDPEEILQQEFFEAAARDTLKVRGRRKIAEGTYVLWATSEPVPSQFWRSATMQPFFEVFRVLSQELRANPDALRPAIWTYRSKFPERESDFFGQVVVNLADLKRRWPRHKKRWFQGSNPSIMRLAFDKYIAEEVKLPDWEFYREAEMFLNAA
jgi:hypothetical protein